MKKMLIFIKYCSKFFPVSIFIIMLLLSSFFFRSFSLTDAFFGMISIVLFSLAREKFTRKTGILIIAYDCILGVVIFLTTVIQVYYIIHRRDFEMNDLSLICDSGVFEFYEFIGDPAQLLTLASGLAALLIFTANEYFFSAEIRDGENRCRDQAMDPALHQHYIPDPRFIERRSYRDTLSSPAGQRIPAWDL